MPSALVDEYEDANNITSITGLSKETLTYINKEPRTHIIVPFKSWLIGLIRIKRKNFTFVEDRGLYKLNHHGPDIFAVEECLNGGPMEFLVLLAILRQFGKMHRSTAEPIELSTKFILERRFDLDNISEAQTQYAKSNLDRAVKNALNNLAYHGLKGKDDRVYPFIDSNYQIRKGHISVSLSPDFAELAKSFPFTCIPNSFFKVDTHKDNALSVACYVSWYAHNFQNRNKHGEFQRSGLKVRSLLRCTDLPSYEYVMKHGERKWARYIKAPLLEILNALQDSDNPLYCIKNYTLEFDDTDFKSFYNALVRFEPANLINIRGEADVK